MSSAVKTCKQLLNELSWSWQHPRVVDWLNRVGQRLTGHSYNLQSQIPEIVFVSLAKFLDMRLKCQRLLNALNWEWDNAAIVQLERKYNCINQLPLSGYRELYALLDEEWFASGGGF